MYGGASHKRHLLAKLAMLTEFFPNARPARSPWIRAARHTTGHGQSVRASAGLVDTDLSYLRLLELYGSCDRAWWLFTSWTRLRSSVTP